MIFRQFIQEDLSCASYMVGDEGSVAIVDPKLGIEDYLEAAHNYGAKIEHIFETHNHADHLSGHGRLQAATGATIHIHRDAEAEYEHEPIEDGWELELGGLTIRAIHTPGHRPEHTAFALIERGRSDEPWALLTGDTLFVGDVARPDLAIDKEQGAREIYRSLHDKLLPLPATTEIWPGHLGGSMCGSPKMSPKIASTLGFELQASELLGIEDEGEFVKASISRIGPQPPNFENIVALNKGELVGEQVVARPLTPRQLERKVADGAFLVDTRTSLQFDDAHIPGATQITILEPGFASKLAWLADPEQEVVVVGRDDEDGIRAIDLAQSVGLTRLGGYLHGGMTAWREEDRPAESIERVPLDDLKERWEAEDLQVLDVREHSEHEEGVIPGSVTVPWHDIDSVPEGIDPARPVAAICGSGLRSGVAASLLRRYGAEQVIHVTRGGVPGWKQRGWPIEQPANRDR